LSPKKTIIPTFNSTNFTRKIETRSKLCASYLVYIQIWLNLPLHDCHFECVFLWTITTLVASKISLKKPFVTHTREPTSPFPSSNLLICLLFLRILARFAILDSLDTLRRTPSSTSLTAFGSVAIIN